MANYFNFFPTTFYSVDANNRIALDVVTNIISRFSFQNSLKENTNVFYSYDVKDTDTPESIAYKLYGDSERHWMVLILNDIIDPQYDWPLKYPDFINYVNNKYAANGAANATIQTGLEWAQSQNNIHSYYQVNTRSFISLTADSKTIQEKVQITANSYANLSVSIIPTQYTLADGKTVKETVNKEKLTYYEYEMQENEKKRKIKLLKPEFAFDVFEEFKQIVR